MAWPDALAAPRRRLLVAVGLAFLFSLVGLARVASTPSLGVKLAPVSEPPAVRVEQVASTSPNLDRLRPGTVLVAARVNGRRVPLNPTTLIEEPDLLDYRAYNRFLERQDLLYQALSQGRLEVVDADGRRILLRAAPTPWVPSATGACAARRCARTMPCGHAHATAALRRTERRNYRAHGMARSAGAMGAQ